LYGWESIGSVESLTVSISVTRLVLLGAGNLNLLETPLRKVDVASAEVAAENLVLKTERCSEGTKLAVVAGGSVADNLDLPVILGIADSHVTVARNFFIALGDGSRDIMRVEVTASLGMKKTNGITVANKSESFGSVIRSLSSVRIDKPVVVGILVVIASDLLLR
jgi:hypothetical protein